MAQIFNRVIFDMPKMSWDKPIEEETLEFLNHMISDWERNLILNDNLREGWIFTNSRRSEALGLIKAYKTVREHIEKEVAFRASIKPIDSTNGGKDE
jgi:hypothetical protein